MFNYGNFKYFIFKIVLGSIFVLISLIVYASLIGGFSNEIGFGAGSNNFKSKGLTGIFGVYLSSYLIILFGYSSYLLPTFFFVNGVKYLLGIKNSVVYLRFFLIIVQSVSFI